MARGTDSGLPSWSFPVFFPMPETFPPLGPSTVQICPAQTSLWPHGCRLVVSLLKVYHPYELHISLKIQLFHTHEDMLSTEGKS